MKTESNPWFPLFEFQGWYYQSYLVLPTEKELDAVPGNSVSATKWAKGKFMCGQAFVDPAGKDRYILDAVLSFAPGLALNVSVKGAYGQGTTPATFEATGIGTEGPTKGAIYELIGWVIPELPVTNGAAKPGSIRGSVRATCGPDAKPDFDLGGMPIGTAGSFVIVSRGVA